MSGHSEGFPKKHIVGFLGSMVLTIAAAWAAVGSGLPTPWIIASIMVMAVIQAGIQLFMFMHMTETESGGIQVGNMLHAFFIAAIIIAGSIWTMSFGYAHNHDDGGSGEMEMENHQDMEE
ncbi:cytochrome aa3 quinol oxidase subunit IV [Salibacterium aidingense]|uniref:cytochrome aa3 quinol oxidase subunit IV n=1 Tax=Salibacterium aidingense TaxID=384933 RepID=UPI0004128B1F|nr:cytochrome aa3 quinol oxidase subunit IV [Salibacterium aidingense]